MIITNECDKLVLEGKLDTEVHANDCYIEYLMLDNENLATIVDYAEVATLKNKVRIIIEVIKEPSEK